MPLGMDIKEGFIVMLEDGQEKSKLNAKLWRVMRRESFQYETGNTSGTAEFSSVASGSKSGFKQIKALEPDDVPPRMSWQAWGVNDGSEYQLKIKPGVSRLGPDSDKEVGIVTVKQSSWMMPSLLYSFWLFHDWYPAIQADNITVEALTPKVWFMGMKYDLLEITVQVEKTRILNEGKLSIITLGGVQA